MKAVSGTQMRTLDQRTIAETNISSCGLMERAGILAGSRLLQWSNRVYPGKGTGKHFVFFAGKGNNGGDAFVAARFLYENSCNVSLYCVEDLSAISGDALTHFRRLPASLQEMAFAPIPESVFTSSHILVDGLLGTGFKGALREKYRTVCRKINDSEVLTASLDIPSGLNADTGEADPDAVCAHVTFTMASPKTGMFSDAGIRLTGQLEILDIGIPGEFYSDLADTLDVTTASDAAYLLKREAFDIHKNSRGHVFLFGGSILYPGAILLASEAALRAGAGLASCFFPSGTHFYSQIPKALILRALPADDGCFAKESLQGLDLTSATVMAAGPGMGQNEKSIAFLAEILLQNKMLVLDADALNLLAKSELLQERLCARTCSAVLTPHPGEMKRLLDSFAPGRTFSSRRDQALFLAEKTRCIIVLKGARSITASPDGRVSYNASGSPALATAGSGDVLCGIISGLTADRKRDLFDSVRLGVFLHGLTGSLACGPVGSRGCIADDLLMQIGNAFRSLKADA